MATQAPELLRVSRPHGPRSVRYAGTISGRYLAAVPQMGRFGPAAAHDVEVVTAVLPFKVNGYILEELIDWDRVPDDPIYRLTFPHRDMLDPEVFDRISQAISAGGSRTELREAVTQARARLNPDVSDQLDRNVPTLHGLPMLGLQHKYRETVLVLPNEGQTCHAHCAYCFRWPQFVRMPGFRQGLSGPAPLVDYLRAHEEVTDVLITGGDPMVMTAAELSGYVDPLLAPELDHVQNIRIGTKSLSYWPFRFTDDSDADDVLRLFDRVVAAGRSLDLMAHLSHPREITAPAATEAVLRVRATGATIRSQAPLVRHVNDAPGIWASLWREEVRLGIEPYYMFVDRDTGAHRYFAVPLDRAIGIYGDASAQVSGLARTARGPVMSATPGKIALDGTATIGDERVFVCRFLQARDPSWVGRPFFAAWSPEATWYTDLRPALGSPQAWFPHLAD